MSTQHEPFRRKQGRHNASNTRSRVSRVSSPAALPPSAASDKVRVLTVPARHGSVAPAPRATAPDMPSTQTDGALALLNQPLPEILPLPRPTTAEHTILIVEDDPHVASAITAGLELEGESNWSVQVAAGGLRALEIALATPPDVVLLDVRLPDLDGAEVYRRLRAGQKTRRARILFLTAGTALDLAQRGIEDGVLLRKPFDMSELMGYVRALLQK